MSNNKKCIFLVLLCAMLVTIAFCTILQLSGQVHPSVDCFAVDSQGRVYVECTDTIRVYFNNQYLYTVNELDGFDNISMKGTCFAITEEDVFLMSTQGKYYEMDLQGNIHGAWPYSEKQAEVAQLRRQAKRAKTTVDGDEYAIHNSMGRTAIVKNGDEVVYELSALSLVVKMAGLLTLIAFFPMVALFIKIILEYWQGSH